jgi:hypothetical protein
MPKFTLIAEHTDLYGKPDGTKVNYEFYVDSLDDVLEHVDLFLRGCGYNPTGQLDYVTDEFPEWTTEEWDTPQEDAELDEWTRVRREDAQAEGAEFHSKYYFDTERNK